MGDTGLGQGGHSEFNEQRGERRAWRWGRPGFNAFKARDDLAKYGSNALLLFLAQIRLGVDDIEAFATNALTDHSNDKKADLVAVVRDGAKVVIGQGYFREKEDKPAAPEDKAADANTAVSWLIAGPLESVPGTLRGAAQEVRAALEAGTVTEFEIWYSHNLPESKNVQRELDQAALTADALIKRESPLRKLNAPMLRKSMPSFSVGAARIY
ncbi:hypothetical protein [Curtobacterium sp. MCPF17_051]|uniref:hypothetical protein n=1 Tax=Curtobacterium sp. MCPF17_051 TaxID=2175640 RepID=UPI0011B7EF31|nr:hypothetical protein [Curtobacterium sp. MCPF17_051]